MAISSTLSIERTRPPGKWWWLFLVTGIVWVIVSFVILASGTTAVATIGYLTGFVLIAAGVDELVMIGFVDSWKWVYALFGVLCLAAGVMALTAPFQTFGLLALLIGWYLLFKGLVSVVFALVNHHDLHLWGLLLAAGIIEMLVGIWAIGAPLRSAWLLILWVGIGALFRGVTEIVLAFQIRNDPDAAGLPVAVA